ncbi:uncharacterized protein LA080_006162 [Diaporthe eres]|nr:uncharacterized protein LA080_006162 [Diaporthe eres]
MDHLPPPHQRCLGGIPIPFVAVDKYSSPIHDYPERSGWDLSYQSDSRPKLSHSLHSRASRNLGSLIQTWLYFGLLTEFLEECVGMGLFRRTGDGAFLLTSKPLEDLGCAKTSALAEHSREHGPATVKIWRDAFDKVLLLVRSHTMRLATEIAKQDDDILLTWLGVTVLAEYLMKATNSFCIRVDVETPVAQTFRLANSHFLCDCGSPILKLMKQRGWCPHDIELLNVAQFKTVSTLWYLANMPTPKTDFSHDTCTPEECKPLYMYRDQYVQAHVEEGCDCALVGPEQAKLAAIINAGKFPLIILEGEQVHVHEHGNGSAFVIISHVWADGKGNPRGNSLPLCIVREMQQLVKELPEAGSISQVPFWIDTLCVPRFPMEPRNEALLRMREAYEQALHVLVLDSYLRRQPASEVSPFELLGLIAVCGWSQRLWTLQEGRTPRDPSRTWFAFKDRVVDVLKECNQRAPLIPTIPSHTVNSELWSSHNQTQLIGAAGLGFDDNYIHSAEFLRQSLRTRATSRKEDEAICLGGGILCLPKPYIKEILDSEDSDERMAKIWAKLPSINVGVAFSKAPQKLKIKGVRWAPATFMGHLYLSNKDWEGPNGCWSAPPALISLAGLVINRSAFIPEYRGKSCHRTMMRLLDPIKATYENIASLCDGDGRWFDCTMEEMWHDAPVDIDLDAQLVIILEGGIDFEDPRNLGYMKADRFSIWGSQKGLLARVSKAKDEVRNYLRRYADGVTAKHPDAIEKVREDDSALKELIESYITEKLMKDTEILELMTAINVRGGWGGSNTLAFDDCIGFIAFLVHAPALATKRQDGPWDVHHSFRPDPIAQGGPNGHTGSSHVLVFPSVTNIVGYGMNLPAQPGHPIQTHKLQLSLGT